DLTPSGALTRISLALGVDERGAGYAGIKDRRAATAQTTSVPFAGGRSTAEALGLELQGITVVRATRHGHKLRPGHLKGNRFTIVLRDVAETDIPLVIGKLEEAGRAGVPNAFGPQRFGKDG